MFTGRGFLVYVFTKRNDSDMKGEMENQMNEEERTNYLGLMEETLKAMGCQPEIDKEKENTLCVVFQGEHFEINFYGVYCRIWDPFWTCIDADDPDLPTVREAVNETNFEFGPAVVLSKPDINGVIHFHTRYDIPFIPEIPDIQSYLKNMLESFFMAKKIVYQKFHRLSVEQTEQKKPHRVIGFTATSEEEENEEN